MNLGLRHKTSKAINRRFTQIMIRTFHRKDAEYAEEIPFAQSGDDDWAKTYSSNLRNVFVFRRLPTNKNLILYALCGREKKFKNHQNRKICLNEIKYLQLLILAKRDFFSRPAPLR